MTARIAKLFVVLGLLAGALTFGTVASADNTPSMSDMGAVHEQGCVPSFSFGGILTSTCFTDVQTPSGNAMLNIHGTVIAPSSPPAQAVIVQNFPCVTSDGLTTDSKVVITPGGQVNGSCKYHPAS